ncbi:hypothetical protein OTB20_06680 [Streptomyces sp. H27-H1]|uniref:hypothetical protein n=1 Tax=Streptomyces sp. H27-H1 TaxID=2996461 RepID=UPI00226F5F58|nr:hypothetical protein [Streptomyces sp. H27-H1]MCY0925894.1 hypothetical protein [Streptomyces sp. H27-H1]
MGIRQKVKVRGGAAVAVAAVLALALAGCGGGAEKTKEPEKSATPQSQESGSPKPASSEAKGSAPLEVIATAQGPSGVLMEINSAARDQDGYLTVSGLIKNTGSSTFAQMATWRGDEKTASPGSIAGATVVDTAGKKRYYVLRDTEGRCACTTGLTTIKVGESVPFFAQYPAPPTTTTEIVFGLPSFTAATIKISG